MCNANTGIKFKTSMISSSSCDFSNAYIHVKEIITVPNPAAAPGKNTDKKRNI